MGTNFWSLRRPVIICLYSSLTFFCSLLPIDIQLRVGTVRNAFGGVVYQVSEIAQHPLFEQVWFTSVDYDVGVVRTETAMVLGLDVKPVALPENGAQLSDGAVGLISGWGVVSVSCNHLSMNYLLSIQHRQMKEHCHLEAYNPANWQ